MAVIGLVPHLDDWDPRVISLSECGDECGEVRAGGRNGGVAPCPRRREHEDRLDLDACSLRGGHDLIGPRPDEDSVLRLEEDPRKLESQVAGADLMREAELAVHRCGGIRDAVWLHAPPRTRIRAHISPRTRGRFDVDAAL